MRQISKKITSKICKYAELDIEDQVLLYATMEKKFETIRKLFMPESSPEINPGKITGQKDESKSAKKASHCEAF